MIEGRPRQSLVLYENPIEITGGMDPNDPFKKSFGGKLLITLSFFLLFTMIFYSKQINLSFGSLLSCLLTIFKAIKHSLNDKLITNFKQILTWNACYIIGKKKGQLPPMESKPKQEEIVDAILPPREWIENGKSYMTISWLVVTDQCRLDNFVQENTSSNTSVIRKLPVWM